MFLFLYILVFNLLLIHFVVMLFSPVELQLTGHEMILGPFIFKVACLNQNLGSFQFLKLDPVTYFQARGLAKLINVEPDKELVSTDCQTSMVFSK